MEMTILVVDDEEDIRDVLDIFLSDIGYNVLTAENGTEALRIFRKENPPIVLSDIKMPGMDGLELLQKIRQENADTEVIMITGHGDMDIAIQSLKYEATDFITKPISDDILENALKRASERLSMRRQIRDYTENLEERVKEQSAKLIEAERLTAIGQAVDGLSSAIWDIAGDLDGGIQYFNEMPCFVSIHSRNLRVVAANQLYKKRLGNNVGGDSWKIYAGNLKLETRNSKLETQISEIEHQAPSIKHPASNIQHQTSSIKHPASNIKHQTSSIDCPVQETFRTGKGQRRKETIKYTDGSEAPVIVYTAPIRNKDGDLELVLEISADVTEIRRLQEDLNTARQRFQQLFDEAPCYISVQDREFRITASNRRFKEDFGDGVGLCCFEIYRHRDKPCPDCAVAKHLKTENHTSLRWL